MKTKSSSAAAIGEDDSSSPGSGKGGRDGKLRKAKNKQSSADFPIPYAAPPPHKGHPLSYAPPPYYYPPAPQPQGQYYPPPPPPGYPGYPPSLQQGPHAPQSTPTNKSKRDDTRSPLRKRKIKTDGNEDGVGGDLRQSPPQNYAYPPYRYPPYRYPPGATHMQASPPPPPYGYYPYPPQQYGQHPPQFTAQPTTTNHFGNMHYTPSSSGPTKSSASGKSPTVMGGRRGRKNAQSRVRAARLRSTIEEIKKKPADLRTNEDVNLIKLHEARRERKNERSKQLAAERKMRYEEVSSKPESERTEKEKEELKKMLKSKGRKNEGDRIRRAVLKGIGAGPKDKISISVRGRAPRMAGHGVPVVTVPQVPGGWAEQGSPPSGVVYSSAPPLPVAPPFSLTPPSIQDVVVGNHAEASSDKESAEAVAAKVMEPGGGADISPAKSERDSPTFRTEAV